MLPSVFITADTEPAKSPPISSGMAHEKPTVHSSEKNATEYSATETLGSETRVAGTVAAAERRNPAIATQRRARFTFPVLRSTWSENQPPAKSPSVPANSGRLA